MTLAAERPLLVLLLGACGRLGFGAVDRDAAPVSDVASGIDSAIPACAFDLCDGFEGGGLAPIWSTHNAVAVDTAFAHRGNLAVHMHGVPLNPGQQDYATITETVTFAAQPSQVWVRAWFRISQLPVGANGMELIAATNPDPTNIGDYVFLTASAVALYAEIPNTTQDAPSAAPVDTWFCLVDHIVVSTTNSGSLDLTSDTIPPISIANIRTQPSPPLVELAFGIGYAGTNLMDNQPTTELWVDDVIVHHAAITCDD